VLWVSARAVRVVRALVALGSGSQEWTIGWTSKLNAFKHYTRPFSILNARPIGAASINTGGFECNCPYVANFYIHL
jgi:hypothetical protein